MKEYTTYFMVVYATKRGWRTTLYHASASRKMDFPPFALIKQANKDASDAIVVNAFRVKLTDEEVASMSEGEKNLAVEFFGDVSE